MSVQMSQSQGFLREYSQSDLFTRLPQVRRFFTQFEVVCAEPKEALNTFIKFSVVPTIVRFSKEEHFVQAK